MWARGLNVGQFAHVPGMTNSGQSERTPFLLAQVEFRQTRGQTERTPFLFAQVELRRWDWSRSGGGPQRLKAENYSCIALACREGMP